MLDLDRILHPTDFSESASAAFERALYLARQYEAGLHLMHVAPAFGGDPLRGAYERSTDEAAFQRHARPN